MRRLRWSMALAVQASAHRMLLPVRSEHSLSPSQQFLFMAISVGLVISAGLMSGLTLGLMSMDLVELEVLKRSGTAKERIYASAIMPIVSNQHFLLVTLLLCNAAAMEALPLFLDRLADPVTAILISVTAVLVFGEVLPQAVCSRYGLAIGYYCAWLVRVLMAATSPISWPIGKLLDVLLGAEHRALFRRGQLKALVDIHGADEGLGGNLTEDEIKVICGALDLTSKTARKSMTPLNKVFMLPADARLNQQTMRSILASGHSRIPVYTRGDRSSIIGLILVKELLQYKTHQEVPVSDVRMRSLPRLPADTPMYDMLKLFQTGRSHMVVLTDTPATARAAVEAAAKAAAAAAEAEAAAAEATSDSSGSSGGGTSPLASMLRSKGRKSKRLQFESPLLQPLDIPEEDKEDHLALKQPPHTTSGSLHGLSVEEHKHPQQPHQDGLRAASTITVCVGQQAVDADLPPRLQLTSAAPDSGAAPPVDLQQASTSNGHLTQAMQQPQAVEHLTSSAAVPGRTSNSSGWGSNGSSSHQNSLRVRSKSGPTLLGLAMGHEGDILVEIMNGPEGVAVPIGIITIEDVIEELMQAEIVDETDLFVDNERSITVNAAALAQSLPDQLRLALQSPQHQAAVAGVAGALVGAAAAAGAGRSGSGAAHMRKLLKQRSSSSLAPPAPGQTTPGGGGSVGGIGQGCWQSGAEGVAPSLVTAAAAPTAAAAATKATPGVPASASSSSGGSSSSSVGVVAAVSAGLAAAATAVAGGGKPATAGDQSKHSERLPLLSCTEQAAAAHNR